MPNGLFGKILTCWEITYKVGDRTQMHVVKRSSCGKVQGLKTNGAGKVHVVNVLRLDLFQENTGFFPNTLRLDHACLFFNQTLDLFKGASHIVKILHCSLSPLTSLYYP